MQRPIFNGKQDWKRCFEETEKVYRIKPEIQRQTFTHNCLTFSNFCNSDRHHWFKVKPTTELMQKLSETMLAIAYDSIYFHFVYGNDSSIVLYAKYNQILGSRKICELDEDTIPSHKHAPRRKVKQCSH